ncbi:MAG: AsmA domain protein [Leptospiraceae bacterium]|nr:AsmA domain protein [Leptospiraceae bacterium]
MMKKILIGAGAFFGVLLIALIGASIYLSSLINEDFIVQQLESSMNCRVEIKELNTGLFSAVSSIGLEGVKLGPRDAVANKGTPQKDRKPMAAGVIEAGSIKLALQFGPLLSKKLVVDKLVIDQAKLNLVILANGGNNLNALFRTPQIVNGERNPALDAPKEEAAVESGSDKPFTAADLPISGSLKKIGFTNSNAAIKLQSTGETIEIADLDLLLTNIDIDGTDLKNHNSAHLEIDTTASILNRQKVKKLKLILTSSGKIVPFDVKTGKVNPAIQYHLTVNKGSTLHSFAVLDALAGSLPVLKNIGLKMDKLSKEAVLLQNVDVVISYSRSLLKLLNEPTFPTRNYDLALRKGSWIRLSNSTHNMIGKVISSEAESKAGIAHVDSEIQKVVKGDAANAKMIRDKLLGSLVENDRVFLAFTSTGSLGNPNVSLLSNIPSITDLLKGSINEAINNRVNNELKKVPGGKQINDALKGLF